MAKKRNGKIPNRQNKLHTLKRTARFKFLKIMPVSKKK